MKKITGLMALVILIVACKKTEQAEAPVIPGMATISTTPISDITTATATAGGNITDDGGAAITEKGVCYSKTTDPTIANTVVSAGTGNGTFIVNIKGLKANTTYYARAFATNIAGTSYGKTVKFASLIPKTVTDIDGNVYQTVKIGTQVWMAENLKTKKYRDGVSILNGTDFSLWINSKATGAYCSNNRNFPNYVDFFGMLYNWYAVNNKHKLAPDGWHIPNEEEWNALIKSLGGESQAGGKLKDPNSPFWRKPNIGADNSNSSHFLGLPGGYCTDYSSGSSVSFWEMNERGNWWISTENEFKNPRCVIVRYDNKIALKLEKAKGYGLSVRCILD